jgi:hypothetical protein
VARLPGLPGVVTQRAPAVGDLDECTLAAAAWTAAYGSGGTIRPSVRAMRDASGVPDRPDKPDGTTLAQARAALDVLAPSVLVTRHGGTWAALRRAADDGAACVLQGQGRGLPSGTTVPHAVGAARRGGIWRVADPMLAEGTAPRPVADDVLRAWAVRLADPPAALLVDPPAADASATIGGRVLASTTAVLAAGAALLDAPGGRRVATAPPDPLPLVGRRTGWRLVLAPGDRLLWCRARLVTERPAVPDPTDPAATLGAALDRIAAAVAAERRR